MKQDYTIEIYSKDNCGYCDAAKRLLEDAGYLYTEYKIESTGDERLRLMNELTDRLGQAPKTVPQIFINNEAIGGFTQLKLRLKGMTPTDSWGNV
jgi:glutaredoxin